MILGIDNGLDGGIVLLSDCRGPVPIARLKMPTVKVKKGSAAREIDRLALFDIFRQIVAPEGLVVCIEECPRHARSKAAMRSMAMSYGTILGVLASFQARLNWRVIQVASGNALAGWQRQMLGTMPQGKTKAAALAAAQSIWPGVQWKHDGIVDAALIAEWGRRKNQLDLALFA